jgi:hypothetical protein
VPLGSKPSYGSPLGARRPEGHQQTVWGTSGHVPHGVPFLTPRRGVRVGKGLTLYPPRGFRDFPCLDTYPSVRPARASPGLSGPLLRQRPSQLGYGHTTGRHGCVRCVATNLSVCRCWTELFRRWPHLVLDQVKPVGHCNALHARCRPTTWGNEGPIGSGGHV